MKKLRQDVLSPTHVPNKVQALAPRPLKPVDLSGNGERCVSHNLSLPCALCETGAWPLRDLRAVADFAGVPVDGHMNREPQEGSSIRLSQVVRLVGRRWVELEAVKLTVLNPIYITKINLMKEIAIGAVDIPKMEIAARKIARGRTADTDPVIAKYMKTILEDESEW